MSFGTSTSVRKIRSKGFEVFPLGNHEFKISKNNIVRIVTFKIFQTNEDISLMTLGFTKLELALK